MDTQDRLEKKAFETIVATYGGKNLQPLLEIVPALYDRTKKDYAFYNVVGGLKTQAKHLDSLRNEVEEENRKERNCR